MDTSKWEWFRYDEIFDIKKGKRLTKADMTDGNIRYIGAIDSNNGLSALIGNNSQLHSGNTISVSYNGSIGYAFYQDKEFWATDDVNVLYPRFQLNRNIAMYLCALIEREQYRYCYGRKWDLETMKASKIKLPAIKRMVEEKEIVEPDWQFMETFIRDRIIPQLPKKAQKVWLLKYDTKPQKPETMKLVTDEWKWFKYSDVFSEIGIAPSKDLNSLENVDDGGIVYLSRSVDNNGYECKVKRIEKHITKGGFISIVMVGIPASAFYQPNEVICAQNILVLRSPFVNEYSALFLCTIIEKEKYRFSYGRTLSKGYIAQHKIKLPAIKRMVEGNEIYEPDWQFMEDYIKSLPYSKNIEPSDPNEVVDELVEMKKEMIKMRRAMETQQNPSNLVNYGTVNIIDNSKNFKLD